MTKKTRIALVTVWFPPQMSVATNRMLAFAEYLSEDFEVEVFSLNDKAGEAVFFDRVKVNYESGSAIDRLLKSNTADSSFKHKLKTGIRIIRSKMQPKLLAWWMNKTTKTLIKKHKENPFNLVISSYAPAEAHEVALTLKKQFPDIPWIADMRDEMSLNPYVLPHLNRQLLQLEQEINNTATAITTVSEPIIDEFTKLCPNVPHFLEIRNGYCHELVFEELKKGSVMKFGYFGSFYGKRKPGVFFEALIRVMKKYPDFKVEIHFIGTHRNFDIPEELRSMVKIEKTLSYLDAVRRMAEMDVNLMIEPTSERKGVFTGKLFDYLSVRRPVLALVDKEDVAAQLIKETNGGYVGECESLHENINAVTFAFEDWKAGTMKQISAADALKLHRKFQVDKLKQLINQIIEE